MNCPHCRRAYEDPEISFCVEDGARLVIDTGPLPRPEPGVWLPALRESAVRPTREVGAVIEGRYVIRGLIGEGGMARVYLAEDLKTQARVALKILRREQTGDRVARERFLREIDVAATIVHPNITRILDAGERRDKAPYLVMEYLTGEPLGAVLDRERILPEPYALELTREAASALRAAHEAGIIHRDIKPDNLFLTLGGGLKLVDFGFAKLKEGSLTATGMAVGTLPYMAPEQALADSVDGRTDVYGLGVTLFHMLTGALPFDDENDAKLLAKQVYLPPPRPSARRQGLDPRVDRVLFAALRKRPDYRYGSMAALLEDVERLLGQRQGEIAAPEPGPEPDVYEPVNPMSRTAARYFRTLVQ